MARISYTSYRFQAPPLMEEDFFDHLKSLPIKEGRIRYHPYDGFIKTFPVWSALLGILVMVSAYMFFMGEKEFLLPLVIWPGLAFWTGGLFSMFSWFGYRMDCGSYYDIYSRHINEAQSYSQLKKLRQGLHSQPFDPLQGLFPDLNRRNRGDPRKPWEPR